MNGKKLCVLLTLCLTLCISAFSVKAESNAIYLDDVYGNDANDGTSVDQAVKTFEKAKDLLANDGTIYLVGSYKIRGKQTWSLAGKGNAMVKRYSNADYGHGGYSNMLSLEDATTELTLENIVIDGGKDLHVAGDPYNEAIVEAVNGGKLTLNAGTVLRNNASSYMGSAVSGWTDKFELVMNDGAVLCDNENNAHEYGGGVFVSEGKFTMNGGRISGNQANRGGGVAIVSGQFIMNGGVIENNRTYKTTAGQPGYGGGLYISSYEGFSGAPGSTIQGPASFTMNGGEIRNNHAQSVGGGILTFPQNGHKVTLDVHNGKITHNLTDDSGGGIAMYFLESELNMDGGEISGNKAMRYGGGIYQYQAQNVTISGGSVNGNESEWSGGGAYLAHASRLMLVNQGAINGNKTRNNGGGVSVQESSLLYVSGGEIKDNRAKIYGGGVYLGEDRGKLHMIGGKVQGNQSEWTMDARRGDGIFVDGKFELGRNAKIDPDNDVFLRTSKGKHIDVISPYQGAAEPIQITSDNDDVEADRIGTKLVLYTEKAGGAQAAAKADRDGVYAPSAYMKEGLTIGQSRYENDWMTYVPGVKITYQWTGKVQPSDVVPPEGDTVRVGTKYAAKKQQPSAQKYSFEGWFTDETCQMPYADGTEIFQNTVLYGKWTKDEPLTPVTVTYTFKPGEQGSISSPDAFTLNVNATMQGSGMAVPTVTENALYHFTGWKDEDGKLYTSEQILTLAATESRTFTAQYEKDKIRVNYQWAGKAPSDVQLPAEETIDAGTAYAAKKPDATKESYRFDGWFADEACQTPYVNGTKLTQNTTIYGKWTKEGPITPVTVTYTFKPGEQGSISSPDAFTLNVNATMQGSGMAIPTVTASDLYEFTGWKGDDGKIYKNEEILKLAATENRTFTAQYEKLPEIDLPKTGDETPLMLLIACLAVSGLVGIMVLRKHKDA